MGSDFLLLNWIYWSHWTEHRCIVGVRLSNNVAEKKERKRKKIEIIAMKIRDLVQVRIFVSHSRIVIFKFPSDDQRLASHEDQRQKRK